MTKKLTSQYSKEAIAMKVITLDTNQLVSDQFARKENDSIPALDLAISLYAIECFHNLNTFGFSLYLKFQSSIKNNAEGLKSLPSFISFIESNEKLPAIKVNKKNQVVEGVESLAKAIFNKQSKVEVERVNLDQAERFDKQWFFKRPQLFSSMEVHFLEDKAKKTLLASSAK